MLTVLKRIDPEEHMDRWYMVTVQPTLLAPVAVICAWGSRRTSWQQMQIHDADSEAAARALAEKIVRQKRKRGYEIAFENDVVGVRNDE